MKELPGNSSLLSPPEATALSHRVVIKGPGMSDTEFLYRPPIPTSTETIPDYNGLPLPEARKKAGPTALHESNHVLVAILRFGIPVEEVSVIPGPDYRGITVFAGDLFSHPRAFQVIAAGGAASTLSGRAEGYGHHMYPGSDIYHVHQASHKTGKSVEAAVAEASAFIDSIPANVRQAVADIIETLGKITSPTLIQRVIDIAFHEAQAAIKPAYLDPTTEENAYERSAYEASIARGDHTIIVIPDEGPPLIGVIKNKKDLFEKNDEKTQCNECKGEGMHLNECSQEKSQASKKKDIPPSDGVQTDQLVEVFDAKVHFKKISLN